jgi:hypothetical protein
MVSLALFGLGCPEGETPPPDEPLPVRLARVDQWVRVTDAEADLFAAGRPEGLVCDEVMGYGLEDFGPEVVFEVQTDLCDWFTGTQPTLEPISPGDAVTVKVWHYDLVAEMDAEAYVALAIGDRIEWEDTVPIPAAGTLLEADLVMDRELPAGTPMQFHVHNHGPNSWELFDVMVTPEADAG